MSDEMSRQSNSMDGDSPLKHGSSSVEDQRVPTRGPIFEMTKKGV